MVADGIDEGKMIVVAANATKFPSKPADALLGLFAFLRKLLSRTTLLARQRFITSKRGLVPFQNVAQSLSNGRAD